jgi:hypothetical protein
MADFCLATKMQPSEYRNLSLREYGAFVKALEDRGGDTSLEDLI